MDNPFEKKEDGVEKGEEVEITTSGETKLDEEAPKETAEVVEEEKETEQPVEIVKENPLPKNNSLSRKQAILESHGGLESNVPLNSAYWKLK